MKTLASRALLLLAIALGGLLAFPASAPGQSNVVGQWRTLPYTMPINPIHVGLMHTGKVLVVAGSENDSTRTVYRAGVLDFQAGAVTAQTVPWDLFCNGMTFLADGRALVVGGNIHYYPFYGAKTTTIFDPLTEKFIQVQDMAHGRWYPSNTVLDDGGTVTFGGYTETGGTNQAVEIYDVPVGWSPQYQAPFLPPLYPWLHLLPSGKLFFSGATPTSHLFDPASATWQTGVATTHYTGERTYGSSVLLPFSSATSWAPRVMIMGGDNPATATVELIDLSAPTPSWRSLPPMSGPRVDMNAVILPSGKILAMGGSGQHNVASTATLAADLFDPATETWSSAGANAYPRLYHSVALLLPDATVWLAGSNPSEGVYDNRMEIYSPAYLFKADGTAAPRPTIGSVPAAIGYGGSFQVQTANAASIGSVVLIRNGSSTHGFDMEQRMIKLDFTRGTSSLTVTGPASARIAPPGYYMLFILDGSGVPSVAKFLRVSATPNNQPPRGTITSPAGNVTIQAGQSVTFAGSGTDPDGSVASYHWIFPNGSPAASTLQTPGAVIFSTPGTYPVSLTVVDNLGANDPSPPVVNVTVQTSSFTAAITAPTEGATVSGTVTVAMSASVAGLTHTLSVDGTTVFSQAVTGTTSSYAWNTGTVSNGAHTLTLTVTDTQGHRATATRTVTVANGTASFTASFQYPANNATVGGTQSVGMATTAPWGQQKTFILTVDGAPITNTPTTGTTLWVDWNTLTAGSGARTLRLTVTSNGQSASATLSVNVSNPPQTLGASFSSPAAGATVSQVVSVGMNVTGASGNSNTFRLSVDGTVVSTQTVNALTASFAWNSATVANGSHTLAFTVTDSAGRTASSTRTVTTSNSGAGGGGGTTPMSAAFTAPASGATVSGSVAVGMSVTGASGSSNTFKLAVDGTVISTQTVAGTTASYTWNTAAAANGAHTLSLTVTDATLRSATATRSVTVSNGTATLGASITAPATNGATVSGTTTVGMAASNAAAGTITYVLKLDGATLSTQSVSATTASYAWNTTTVSNGSHTLGLTVTDSAGRTATATRSVNVANGTASFTASFQYPASGATVGGVQSVGMATTAPWGQQKTFALKVDGTLISSTPTTGTTLWVDWTTTSTSDGAHTLNLTVTDAQGQSATASLPVIVSNGGAAPFSASFTAPASGATVSGTVTVGMAETGGTGAITYRLAVDGGTVSTQTTSAASASYAWNTATVANGSHTLQLTVTDGGGRTASATRTVTVSNGGTAPFSASFQYPASGATVGGTQSVGMATTAPWGQQKTFTLKVDGTLISSTPTTGTTLWIDWNTLPVSNGPHTLTLTVTDDQNRSATATLPVTVSN